MQNTPYDLSSVTPLESLLLGRLQAAEAMLAGIVNVVGTQLPASKPTFDSLVQQAGKGIERAEETAAAQWLFLTDHPGSDTPKTGSYEDALALSEAAATQITDALNAYLPMAGISSMFGDIGHPVCLGLDRFLEAWGLAVELPDQPAEFLEALLKSGNELTLYRSRALHPAGQAEPLFIVGALGKHMVALAPARLTWQVITCPSALADQAPPFFHRQARVVDLKKALKQIDEIFSGRQTPKLRAFLRERSEATTTIQVLLSEIFQAENPGEVELNREGLFHYAAACGQHAKLNRMVAVQRIEGQNRGLQLGFSPEQPKYAFIMVGESAVPSEIDALEPQTKAILIEVLSALAKKVKPSKKKHK